MIIMFFNNMHSFNTYFIFICIMYIFASVLSEHLTTSIDCFVMSISASCCGRFLYAFNETFFGKSIVTEVLTASLTLTERCLVAPVTIPSAVTHWFSGAVQPVTGFALESYFSTFPKFLSNSVAILGNTRIIALIVT